MSAVATGQGARGATPTSPLLTSNGTKQSTRSTGDVAKANNMGAKGENEDNGAKTVVALSPVEVRQGTKQE